LEIDYPAQIEIKPSSVEGTIEAPGSKSYTHRAIIATSLAEGISIISKPVFCEDTEVTMDVCNRLGAQVVKKDSNIEVEGFGDHMLNPGELSLGNSGTTLRLTMGLSALVDGFVDLTTHPGSTLINRPSSGLIDALTNLGVIIESRDGCLPIRIKGGKIKGGRIEVSGKVSSQFVSALLLIAPKTEEGLEIKVVGGLKSKPYVEITIDVMKLAGIKVSRNRDFTVFKVKPQKYKSFNFTIPGDYSSAAPLMCAALATNSELTITNLVKDKQGDRAILDILKKMGAKVKKGRGKVSVSGNKLKGIELDGGNTPDLIPPIAGLACLCKGKSRFYNIGHLRNKESDRISDLSSELKKIGAKIKEKEDEFTVTPGKVKHAIIDPHNDHRIAMALTIASLGGKGITLINPNSVRKSYPGFFKDLKFLGAQIEQ
jgi:3-phosphoshikimate 1-carboxyvinyltransferase